MVFPPGSFYSVSYADSRNCYYWTGHLMTVNVNRDVLCTISEEAKDNVALIMIQQSGVDP